MDTDANTNTDTEVFVRNLPNIKLSMPLQH